MYTQKPSLEEMRSVPANYAGTALHGEPEQTYIEPTTAATSTESTQTNERSQPMFSTIPMSSVLKNMPNLLNNLKQISLPSLHFHVESTEDILLLAIAFILLLSSGGDKIGGVILLGLLFI